MMPMFDFDGTVGHYEGGYERLFAPLSEYGYQLETIRELIREHIPVAEFSLERLAQELGAQPRDDIARELRRSLHQSIRLYDDARVVLDTLRQRDQPYVIVTCGNPAFQRYKITRLHLQPDEVIITRDYNTKGAKIRALCRQYRTNALYIDNKLSELDNVRLHCGDQVQTVWINRTGEGAPAHPHREISDLRQIMPHITVQP